MQGFAWHGIAPSLGTYIGDSAGRHKSRICAALPLPSSAEWTARISDPNPASQHENGPRVLFQDPGVLCMCIGHSLFEYKHRSLKHYSHPPATQTGGLNRSVELTTHRSRTHYMIRNLPNKPHIVHFAGATIITLCYFLKSPNETCAYKWVIARHVS